MKWKSIGRAALHLCASAVLGLGISSCATSTLGYLYTTSSQYGEVASLRLEINSGKIAGVGCSTHNGSQQDCNIGSGGTTPTKLVSAQGNSYLYVLNASSTGQGGGNVATFSLGPSGGVYATGETYNSAGQNPIDLYLNPSGNLLYVLDQFQPASVAGCANPTPSTCAGDITVFLIGNNGSLTPVQNSTNQSNPLPYFPVGYIPNPYIPTSAVANGNPPFANTPNLPNGVIGNHLLVSGSYLYVLDEATPGTPQIDLFSASTTTGQITPVVTGATQNASFVHLSSIIGGTSVYVADSYTGQIWVYASGSGGALTAVGTGVVCPSLLAGASECYENPGNTTALPVAIASMVIDPSGQFLYAADYNNGTIFTMAIVKTAGTGTGGSPLIKTTDGGNTALGANVTCMTVSSGTEFLYASGNGLVAGEQIDTEAGNLTDNDHPTTNATFTGLTPCVVYSPRT